MPEKSWPLVGMASVPLCTPVMGVPGWTCPSWRKSMFQVKALGGRIREQVAELKPSKITIETGIAVAVKNGKLTALLVDGQADVSFTLTLEWDLSEGEAD